MIGELLYGLSNRDTGGQFLEIFQRRLDGNAAAVNVQASVNVPTDRIWIVQSMTVRAQGGGAQTCNTLQVRTVITGNAFSFFVVNDREAARNAVIRCWNWNGELYVRGGSALGFTCDFSAGAIANDVTMSLHGVSLPLGNVGAG